MKSQVLTVDQIEILKNKGFEPKNSNLYWVLYSLTYKNNTIGKPIFKLIIDDNDFDIKKSLYICVTPTITLQNILEILPEKIDKMNFSIEKKDGIWYIGYYMPKETCICFNGVDLLNEANNLLNWCIDNKHLNNK